MNEVYIWVLYRLVGAGAGIFGLSHYFSSERGLWHLDSWVDRLLDLWSCKGYLALGVHLMSFLLLIFLAFSFSYTSPF